MLKPTVGVAGLSHTNLLHVIVRTGNHTLPPHTTSWALTPVTHDRHGEFVAGTGFRFSRPGTWATATCPSIAPYPCGLHLATTEEDPAAELWHAAPFDILPADDLLLLAYHQRDLLHSEGATVQVRKAFVVAHVSGLELIKKHGPGADLHGLWLAGLDWMGRLAIRSMMSGGATYAELAEVVAKRIDARFYYDARFDGATHRQALRALRPRTSWLIRLILKRHARKRGTGVSNELGDPLRVLRYIMASDAGVPTEHAAELALTNLQVFAYVQARKVATHAEIMRVPEALGHSHLGRYTTLRSSGHDHDTAVAHCAQEPPF
ncbi:hypothetical protein [Nonomuraea sp. NPDC049400]|uniref:hypothetical protein n=1 Tax=Nonomuraea sp. NPDC049400 TaxID=3364352 RepID=UPI003798628A